MSKLTPTELENLAWLYVQDCENHTIQKIAPSGKVVNIIERKIPTVNYFLRIWIPAKGKPTISRTTYYRWLNSPDAETKVTLNAVEGLLEALATDVIANSSNNRGNFYARNKLGWRDQPTVINTEVPLFVLDEAS